MYLNIIVRFVIRELTESYIMFRYTIIEPKVNA